MPRLVLHFAIFALALCVQANFAHAGKICDADSESKIGSRITVTGEITYIAPADDESFLLSDGKCELPVLFPPFWTLDKSCRVGGSASVSAVIVKAGPDDLSLAILQATTISCR